MRLFFDWVAAPLLCLLLPRAPAAGAERVLLESPVRVVTSSDPGIFPEAWRKAPVDASGLPLADGQVDRVAALMKRAAAKYPTAVLKKHLDCVYVLSELKYRGVVAGGTNSRTSVYLKVGDVKEGFTDEWVERVFHAEFSSILLRNRKKDLNKEEWRKLNPPEFRYLGDGVDAIQQRKAGLRSSEKLLEQGFLAEYSQSTLENDFNGFAASLFVGGSDLWDAADKHPKICGKLRLTIDFYQAIDPIWSEKSFREMMGR